MYKNIEIAPNKALFGYSTGLFFYALSISVVRIFNAFHDMKTPAIIGVTSIVINALLAALLMAPFGNLGISLATSIVSLYNFLTLFIILKKKTVYRLTSKTARDIIKSLAAGIVLLILLAAVKKALAGSVYLSLIAGILLTATVYGIVFKDYYLLYMKRKT